MVADATNLPELAVLFITRNRTATACFVLESLLRNLRYSGRTRYVICDDRSYPGHVEALEGVFGKNKFSDFAVCRTNATRWGIGASMNNGLHEAFRTTDVVLTIEDDWLCRNPFDITPFVRAVLEPCVAGIRFGSLDDRDVVLKPTAYDGLSMIERRSKTYDIEKGWVFNNQVMLRHKRVFDEIGFYDECATPNDAEYKMKDRFNERFESSTADRLLVLWPDFLRHNSLEAGVFEHIGKSTINHGYSSPLEFDHLNDPDTNTKLRANALREAGFFDGRRPLDVLMDVDARMEQDKSSSKDPGRPFFKIVIPAYNVESYIDRCIRSIASQTFKDFIVSVCDDSSTDTTPARLKNLQKEFPWLVVTTPSKKLWIGGARNAAMDAVDGEYTMHLDSDDYLADDEVLQRTFETICANGGVDAVRISYIEGHSFCPDVVVHMHESTPEQLAGSDLPMSWGTCVRTSKEVRFPEEPLSQEDVVYNLYLADNIDTIVPMKEPSVVYTDANSYSVSKRPGQNGWYSSWLRAGALIMDMKYKHPWMAGAKRRVFKIWLDRFEREKEAILNSIH